MSGVHNADSHLLAGNQDGRDVPADEGKDVLDPVGAEHSRHALAAVPRALRLRLDKVKHPVREQAAKVTD